MLLRVGLEVYTHREAYEIYEELTRIRPLTTFLASTDSSIACDCIYMDAALCHDAREAHVGQARKCRITVKCS